MLSLVADLDLRFEAEQACHAPAIDHIAEEAFGPEDGARVARGLSAANVGIDPVADSAGNGVSAQEGLRVAVLDTYQSKHGAAPHFARQQTLAVALPAQQRAPRTERIKVAVRVMLLVCVRMV